MLKKLKFSGFHSGCIFMVLNVAVINIQYKLQKNSNISSKSKMIIIKQIKTTIKQTYFVLGVVLPFCTGEYKKFRLEKTNVTKAIFTSLHNWPTCWYLVPDKKWLGIFVALSRTKKHSHCSGNGNFWSSKCRHHVNTWICYHNTHLWCHPFEFFTIRISDRSVRSDRSLSGFLLLAIVCVNFWQCTRNLASTGNIK